MKYCVDGVEYRAEECGSGFPLVTLHGFTGAATNWKAFCPVWGEHSSMLMPDLIGHGMTESPHDSKIYSIEKAADALATMLEENGAEQADFLGYSMGGRLAVTFAARYPEKVRKLVLESTSPGLRNDEERAARIKQDGMLAEMIVSKGIQYFVDYWESIQLFSSQTKLPKAVRAEIRQQRLGNNPIGLANSLLGMGTGAQPSWWNEIESFSCETLLLSGSLDPKFCGIAKEMSSKIPHCRHLTINDAGHAIHVEQPEKFGTIVSRFLCNTYI
ncbi:2-succinyl-6-hydroxy-2,4-cyclohexadiene-1-carboxylate synthase [Mesobacillus zeae]|uniref:Putative 2-succinyl-6-hydroxy-2,4-cyclohexadiene-1-carboxylate synthase n=1 Tax=Mesobacillus zeae TaxID=1917180 RepID=A0A398AZL8_9BACI|nr:2-succinyl-6-hydroxy-2,4-cyclohexadiene-1-carboxylate synthase [Mesobacillus zeae]RID83025.1 2-succinyl-6-hydroxy-2,4-cyclohexadiene-1-carboxylate synthase [Mesobacillus zeae]